MSGKQKKMSRKQISKKNVLCHLDSAVRPTVYNRQKQQLPRYFHQLCMVHVTQQQQLSSEHRRQLRRASNSALVIIMDCCFRSQLKASQTLKFPRLDYVMSKCAVGRVGLLVFHQPTLPCMRSTLRKMTMQIGTVFRFRVTECQQVIAHQLSLVHVTSLLCRYVHGCTRNGLKQGKTYTAIA